MGYKTNAHVDTILHKKLQKYILGNRKKGVYQQQGRSGQYTCEVSEPNLMRFNVQNSLNFANAFQKKLFFFCFQIYKRRNVNKFTSTISQKGQE